MSTKDGEECIRMLVALLTDPDSVGLSHPDKQFLLVTCCMSIVMATVCDVARYSTDSAFEGFDKLAADARKQIPEACRLGRILS